MNKRYNQQRYVKKCELMNETEYTYVKDEWINVNKKT